MINIPVVDVIIPIYNRKQYVSRLVRMLEAQKLKDFCAIFVDDGSTDGTYEELVDQLKTATYQYKLLRQKNGGPSKARNTGIKAAESKWITFADSDDILTPEFLAYLYAAVSDGQAEMGYCHLTKVPEGNQVPLTSVGELSVQTHTAAEAMKNHYTDWIAPFCLILNKKWLTEAQLLFDEKCRYCEDLIFITEAIAAAEHVREIHNCLYVYLPHSGSALRCDDVEKYWNGMEGFDRLEEKLSDCDTDAAKVFFEMGRARYLLATLRRAALQMQRKRFVRFARKLEYKNSRSQMRHLPWKWQIAGGMFLVSPNLFYFCVRMLFSD